MILYRELDSIEGAKISGNSRKPLDIKNRGMKKINNIIVYHFVASFNVKAEVTEEISDEENKIVDNSVCYFGVECQCDKASIYSMTNKYRDEVSKGSATHKTNYWDFAKQSSVTIIQAHKELENGMRKRGIV